MILVPDELHHDVWEQRGPRRRRRRQHAAVRPRLLDPLRRGRTAAGRRRRAGRAEGSRATSCAASSPRAPAFPGWSRSHQDATGNALPLALAYAKGIGCTRGGVIETTLQGRDRDRPLRRAGGPLRRRLGARAGRLRDARRGRLRPGDGLLRVPARAQADRRSDVREGPRRACATRSPTRPSTATTRAASASITERDAREHEADPRPTSSPARSRASGSPRTAPSQENFLRMRAEQAASQIERVGRSCARTWTGSSRASSGEAAMLAYVFWHRPADGVARGRLRVGDRALPPLARARPPAGFVGSVVASAPACSRGCGDGRATRTGTWSRTSPRSGVLNEAAVARGHLSAHDAAARLAGPGSGRHLPAARGLAATPSGARVAVWIEKPRGVESPVLGALLGDGMDDDARRAVAAPARARAGARVLRARAGGAGRRRETRLGRGWSATSAAREPLLSRHCHAPWRTPMQRDRENRTDRASPPRCCRLTAASAAARRRSARRAARARWPATAPR